MSEWHITESGDSVTFAVRVMPRSSRNQIVGVEGGALKIRLTAPPVADAANVGLIEFVADWLDVPKSVVAIVKGNRARSKILRVKGISRDRVLECLNVRGRV